MGRKGRGGDHGGGGGGHDGGGSLRWLLTYADMITLLMAFFIMLYSMSILNLKKFHEVAVSIRSGFNGIAIGQGRSILGQSGQMSINPSPIDLGSMGLTQRAARQIHELVVSAQYKDIVRVRQDERGLIISMLSDKVLFPKGKTEFNPESTKVLDKVIAILSSMPNDIRVEGHTCDLPVRSDKYPTNWELSSARASRVVRYMIENGIPAVRLSAAGYADKRPLPGFPNNCEANRAVNRRVDIVIEKQSSL